MRTLVAGTNIDAPSGDYPKGRVRDLNGGAGTIVNEVMVGDLIQFFQKLVIDAGIVENGNPDNVSQGYQLLEALVSKIRDTSATTAEKGTSELATQSEGLAGTDTGRTITPQINSYTNRFVPKTMAGSELYNIAAGVGRIFIPHSTNNTTIRLPSVSLFSGAVIHILALGVTTGSVIEYPQGTTIQSVSSNTSYICISNGTKWYIIENSAINNADGLACPFVYVNGVYFDEILKNIVDVDGEETLDISKVMEIGINDIKISEEKDEVTYIKELSFNGKILDMGLVLKKGESKEYEIYYQGGFAELKAVGHYKYS